MWPRTAGAHGLPLFSTGDWNDGMNRVGHAGRGESTWLGFSLHGVLTDFPGLCDTRHDLARATRYRAPGVAARADPGRQIQQACNRQQAEVAIRVAW